MDQPGEYILASTPAGNLNSESKRILLEEWKECRRAVRAFDSTVTHIRSYSVLVTIALLALGGFFAITEPPLRGFVIEVLALVFLGGEFLLESHYRGYLHAAVNRATAIERIIVPPESPQVFLKRNEVPAEAMSTKAMISEVISVQR